MQKVSRSASMAARFRKLPKRETSGDFLPKQSSTNETLAEAKSLCVLASNSDLLSEGVKKKGREKKSRSSSRG